MDLEAIKQTLDSGIGLALKEYLTLKLEELKSIDNIIEKDTSANQTLELKSQRRAYLKLKEIMQEIMTFSENKREKDPRDNYGVTDDDL